MVMKVLGLWSREAKLVLQRAAGGCKRPNGDTSSGLGTDKLSWVYAAKTFQLLKP